jgi:hypothetical protein
VSMTPMAPTKANSRVRSDKARTIEMMRLMGTSTDSSICGDRT